jgi:halocyanin-like protein
MRDISRRRFVRGTGAAVAASALAGCGSDGGDGNDGDVPESIADHMEGANEYDGSLEDQTGEDEVTVEVGAGDGFAFDPAAVRVDAGTTVVWEWTGEGSQHNVSSTGESDADFQSDLYEQAGEHFEQSFDQAGTQLYVCQPHEGQGMRGAIEVVGE